MESITESGTIGSSQPLYSFDYYSATHSNYSEVQDFWGYKNGRDISKFGYLLPASMVGDLAFDRNPDLEYTRMGVLKAIYYLSGGSEEFEYEPNDKLNTVGVLSVTGGVRLKRRVLHDGVRLGNDQIKEYKYIKEDGKSSGFGDESIYAKSGQNPTFSDWGGAVSGITVGSGNGSLSAGFSSTYFTGGGGLGIGLGFDWQNNKSGTLSAGETTLLGVLYRPGRFRVN